MFNSHQLCSLTTPGFFRLSRVVCGGGGLNQQVDRVKETYRLSAGGITDIDAFSLCGHLNAFKSYSAKAGERATISVFVSALKFRRSLQQFLLA